MSNQVIEFINRRFPSDNMWTSGNCFYFALILKARFPSGKIYYDVIYGHFIFEYEGYLYDWDGMYYKDDDYLVEWDKFNEYDSLQKEIIVRDCIM